MKKLTENQVIEIVESWKKSPGFHKLDTHTKKALVISDLLQAQGYSFDTERIEAPDYFNRGNGGPLKGQKFTVYITAPGSFKTVDTATIRVMKDTTTLLTESKGLQHAPTFYELMARIADPVEHKDTEEHETGLCALYGDEA